MNYLYISTTLPFILAVPFVSFIHYLCPVFIISLLIKEEEEKNNNYN
jgi:hypothetical protein